MDTPIQADMTLYARWADKSNQKQLAETMERISVLVPLGLIGVLGIVLLAKEIRSNRKE